MDDGGESLSVALPPDAPLLSIAPPSPEAVLVLWLL